MSAKSPTTTSQPAARRESGRRQSANALGSGGGAGVLVGGPFAEVLTLQRMAGNGAVHRSFGRQWPLTTAEAPFESSSRFMAGQSGQPLDPAVRADMETAIGHHFGDVRVHASAEAAESAEAVDARAYAIGTHLVFGNGEYRPGTLPGRQLLAHELAHVVQQKESGIRLQRDAKSTQEGTTEEAAARKTANATVPMYQFTHEGKTVTLTEEEYKKEVARAAHQLELAFNLIEAYAEIGADTHKDFLEHTHNFWGIASDIVADTAPPTLIIWKWPNSAIIHGREALKAGRIEIAGRMLQLAQEAYRDAQREWNTYIDKTVSGAQKIQTVAEYTRDISFSIAIGTAAVIAAPVVAGAMGAGLATAGVTGTTATVLTTAGTGAVVTAGGAGGGAVLRGASSAAGQKLATGRVDWKEVKKEAHEGAKRGAVDAATAVTGVGAAKALGPGTSLVSHVAKGAVAGTAGGAVGGGLGAGLEGKSAREVVKSAATGAASGAVGGAVGGAGSKILGSQSGTTRAIAGGAGGAAAGGAGAALSGGSSEEIKQAAIIGGVSGGVVGAASHEPASKPGRPSKATTAGEPEAATTASKPSASQAKSPEGQPSKAADESASTAVKKDAPKGQKTSDSVELAEKSGGSQPEPAPGPGGKKRIFEQVKSGALDEVPPPRNEALGPDTHLHVVDENSRPVLAEGRVKYDPEVRSESAQKAVSEPFNKKIREAGGPKGEVVPKGDIHASHMTPRELEGFKDVLNLVPLPEKINTGPIRELEREIVSRAQNGEELYLQVHARYSGRQRIPTDLMYRVFKVDGKGLSLVKEVPIPVLQ